MRCPICDQKAMNCDCTPEERRQFSEIEDLENEISRMKMQSASEALAWSLGQMWVAVEDRMPEKNTPVLVVTSGVVTEMEWDGYAWYYGPNEAWEGCNTVTHWMPMPEPPRD